MTLTSCLGEVLRTAEEQSAAAVLVMSPCGQGSGVIIDSTHILTATHLHVVRDDKGNITCQTDSVIVVDDNHQNHLGIVVDADGDISRVVVGPELPDSPPTEVRTVGPLAFVWVCMAPAIPEHKRKCGLTLWAGTQPWSLYFAFPSIPGNSGAAIYDRYGALVGIALCYPKDNPKVGCGSTLWNRAFLVKD